MGSGKKGVKEGREGRGLTRGLSFEKEMISKTDQLFLDEGPESPLQGHVEMGYASFAYIYIFFIKLLFIWTFSSTCFICAF